MSNNRNLPCWCGSGKKYKKCHLHREEQKKVDTWDMVGKFKREFNKKYCLCPKSHKIPCQGKIINAHTVSKSGSLKHISRNGHIYTFLLTLEKFIQAKDKAKNLQELTGINKASTFTGFCKTHDRILFSPIENDDFIATKEQVFLLSYRALSREIYSGHFKQKVTGRRRLCGRYILVETSFFHRSREDFFLLITNHYFWY